MDGTRRPQFRELDDALCDVLFADAALEGLAEEIGDVALEVVNAEDEALLLCKGAELGPASTGWKSSSMEIRRRFRGRREVVVFVERCWLFMALEAYWRIAVRSSGQSLVAAVHDAFSSGSLDAIMTAEISCESE